MAQKERILGLPRNIFFLGFTSLFNDFSSEMIYSIFPAFFTSVLHAGAESLGLVDGVAEAASNFFKIYSGRLSDRLGRRKSLVISGYALSVFIRPFYLFVASVSGVLGIRFLDRVGKGLRDAPRDAIISLSSPKEELGRSFGYHRAMDTTGAILGPLVAYLILRFFPMHFDYVFMSAFIVGIFALLMLFFIADVAVPMLKQYDHHAAAFRNLPRRFKLFLLAIFVLSVGSLPLAVVLLKTESIGLILADIPLFYLLYNLSYAAFSMSAGKLSDRIGARTVILIGYLLLIASYFILNIAETSLFLAFGFLFFGLFPALTDGVGRAFASQLTAPEMRGSALGWLNAANGFGALIAGIGGGYVWQVYSPSAAFMVAALITISGLLFFIIALRSR